MAFKTPSNSKKQGQYTNTDKTKCEKSLFSSRFLFYHFENDTQGYTHAHYIIESMFTNIIISQLINPKKQKDKKYKNSGTVRTKSVK